MGLIDVKLDTSKLSQWASELSARGFKNALRRAIDQSARAARKVTVKSIAADIGVSASKIKAATPKVQTTTAGNLSARFTVSKLRINILDVAGAKISKSGGLTASTHRLTGGGSASLSIKNAFLVTTAAGGRFIAYRRGRERLPIKGVYGAMPNTVFGQDDSVPQKLWIKTADKELATRLPSEIQKALVTEGLSGNTPDTSGD